MNHDELLWYVTFGIAMMCCGMFRSSQNRPLLSSQTNIAILYKAVVQSVLLFGSETWALTESSLFFESA